MKLFINQIILLVALISLDLSVSAQISYTSDCSSTSGWTLSRIDRDYYQSAGCDGGSDSYTFEANLYSSYPSGSFYRSFTSNGNSVTYDFDFSAQDYSSSTVTSTSSYDVYLQYSTNASTWTTVATMSKSSSSGCQSKSLTHASPASGTIYYRIFAQRNSGDFDIAFDNISVQQTSGPSITTVGSLSAFSACSGSNSSEQSYSVSGSSLSANISITAPTGFEISKTSGSGFGSSVTLTQSGGTVGSTTIYVRTKTDATSAGGGNIEHSSSGATTINVATGSPTIGLSTIYVNDNSTTGDIYASAAFDGSGDGTISDPVNTIADALAMATCGVATTIYVDAGTYTEENINIADNTDNITITGAGASLTIFDGDNSDDWMQVATGSSSSGLVVEKMTVKEYGGSVSQSGGALRILGSSITFQDMIFESCSTINTTTGEGAVFAIENAADVTFNRCIMRSNWSYWGGSVGYHATSGTVNIYNTAVYENSTGYSSCIWQADNTGTLVVTNCVFADNTVSNTSYGTISCWTGTATVNNTIFENNGDSYDPWDNSGSITCNYCMYDAADGTTNNTVSGSPTFVSSSNDDYRLRYGSTGIDAGSNSYVQGSTDLNGSSRTQNSTVDLGPYEWGCSSADAGTSGTSSTVCNNTTTTLTSYGYTAQYYKWQNSTDNSNWSDISSSNSSDYTTPALTTTTYYRNAASCDNSSWVYGSSITKTVNHNIYYVNDNSTSGDVFCSAVGNDSNNGSSASTPKLTLAAALTLASCGDTIKVDAGTYTADNNTIPDGTTELYIMGAGKTLTLFDGDNTDEWMTFSSGGNTSNITITDMTVKEYGGTASQAGGALRVLGGSGILFEDIIFETCSAYYSTTGQGGVLYLENSASCEFSRCIMRHNWADYEGSVAYHASNGTLTMSNCLMYENDADNGNVINIDEGVGTTLLYNCTMVDNTGSSSYGSISCWHGTATAYNCIFDNNAETYDVWDNSATMTCNYCNYDAADGTQNNTVSGSPTFTDAAGDDYTLTSSSVGVDAGNNSYVQGSLDLAGAARTQDGTVDLGAYEFTVNTWTGSTSSDWNTASNWSAGVVPGVSDGAVIANVATNDPVIGNFAATCGNLTINSGAVLTITATNSSYYFAVSSSLSNSGTITHSGTVPIRLSGSSATLSGSGTQTTAKYDIQSGGSYTLGASWSIDDMKVSSGGSLSVSDTYTFTVGDDFDNDGTFECVAGSNLSVGDLCDNSGTLTINSGTLNVDGTLTLTGSSAGTFNANTGTIKCGADLYFGTGTLNYGTSTLEFDGSVAQTIQQTGITASYGGTSTVTAFSETFESGLGNFTSSGDVNWSTTGSYYKNGSNCAWNDYTSSDDNYLTSSTIDLSNHTDANLTFSHICKTEGGYDYGYVQYSEDDGSSWTTFPSSKYSGSGGSSSSWDEDDYSTWGTSTETPNNSTWWKDETYDMDFLVGQNDIKIRFKISSDGSVEKHGWLIDDVEVSGTASSGPAGRCQLSNEPHNITINNSNSSGITLNDEFGFSGSITLTDGVITTGSTDTFYVEDSTAGTLGAGSSASFINGNIKANVKKATGTWYFPAGKGTTSSDYMLLEFNNASLAGLTALEVKFVSGATNTTAAELVACGENFSNSGLTDFTLDELSEDGYFNIEPHSTPGGATGSYGIKMYTTNYSTSTWQDNKIVILKRSSGSTSDCDWDSGTSSATYPADGAAGRNVSDGYLTVSGLSSFSDFIPGGDGGGGLPIELSRFSALLNDQGTVDISWSTETETNNDFFTVERTSDSQTFEPIEEIPGAGNSVVRIDYTAEDPKPLPGVSYYRLKQTDYDGLFSYSDLVSVRNNFNSNLSEFSVYHQGREDFQIRYTLEVDNQYNLLVYDIVGKQIYSGILNGMKGENITHLSVENMTAGLYFVTIQSGQELHSRKVVVQR